MSLTPVQILDLEAISARAWPAERSAALGGWRLNASAGWSGRINACWPLGDPGRPLRQAIGEVEAWYRAAALAPLFKIVDAPGLAPGLIEALATRGYRPRTETLMMVGPAGDPADPAVRIADEIDPSFQTLFAAAADSEADATERLGALSRVPRPRAFARLDEDGEPAAVGASAVEGDWAGLFAMRTGVAFRRRGLARRVLGSLMAWAAGAGASRIWLQVEADNAGAVALYRGAGFETLYAYRYWRR